jgi:type II secretory pathway component GspD/PulD (secretin)
MFSKKLISILCLTLALILFTLPVFTQEEEKAEEAKKEITVDYPQGAEITDFLRFIREKLGPGVSILPAPDVTGKIKPIYLTATPEVILDRVLRVNGFSYDWNKTDNIIEIYKKKRVEKEELKEMVSATFRPKYITAKALEPRLMELKSPDGKVLVEELVNLIFVTDYRSNIKSMKALVKVLDSPMTGIITTKTFITKYQPPSELAKSLKKLKSKKGKVVPNDASMTISVTDYPNIIDSMQKYIESVDVKRLVTQQFPLSYAKAEDLKDTLESFLSESGVLEIDERTNTVIIKDMPEYIKDITKQIELLDVATKQVLIEATFVEISWGGERNLTLNWSLFEDTTNSRFMFGQYLYNSPLLGARGVTSAHSDVVRNFTARIEAKYEGISYNILSNPKVVVTDKQEAIITVGRRYPIVTGATTAEGYTETVVYEDISIELTVTPEIKPNDVISMNITPQTQEISGFVVTGQPIIDTRKLQISQIDVKDGKTVMIGGLLKETVNKTRHKIPILGSIPLLGVLFRNAVDWKVTQELVVFVTPHLLRPTHALDDSEMKEKAIREMGLLEWGPERVIKREEEKLSPFERMEREILGK